MRLDFRTSTVTNVLCILKKKKRERQVQICRSNSPEQLKKKFTRVFIHISLHIIAVLQYAFTRLFCYPVLNLFIRLRAQCVLYIMQAGWGG